MTTGGLAAVALALVLALGCSAPSSTLSTASPAPTGSAVSPATESPVPTPADLTARPLVWFAPLPPLPVGPGRPYVGSEDFMDLFAPGAPWPRAAERVDVFKLYGEWVGFAGATNPSDLATAVAAIRDRGLLLGVEAGPLDATAQCGQGVESFAGSASGLETARTIRRAGGELQVIALDEPYYFGHVYDGPDACHWSIEEIADGVAAFVSAVRQEFPWVLVGDIEPTPAPVDAAGLGEWLDAYKAAVGEAPAFLHLDIDWGRAGWPELGVSIRATASDRGVPLGMIYNGGTATSDPAWALQAGRRVVAFETAAGGPSDHLVFQSWNDKPDRVLPETEATSFTAFIDRYFDDRAALDRPLPGQEVNVAVDGSAKASASMSEAPPVQAIDGDRDTLWNAGQGPPAWIEIDLGAALSVAEIRLVVAQDPPGETRHRVTARSTEGGEGVALEMFAAPTTDGQVLVVTLDASAKAIRFIRVETLDSPSFVAWREIEVIAPQ